MKLLDLTYSDQVVERLQKSGFEVTRDPITGLTQASPFHVSTMLSDELIDYATALSAIPDDTEYKAVFHKMKDEEYVIMPKEGFIALWTY